jgi:Zn-dependent peptidase ImmA (M78 family)/DNA-binding XRE family transcriptional regulator
MSQVDAAAGIGVSRPTLIAVEQGRREPTASELVEFARLYGRDVHELVRDSPPVEALSARFRAAAQAPVDTKAAVDELQRLADDVLELELSEGMSAQRRWPEEYDVTGLTPDDAGALAADEERKRLGLGDGPISNLRQVLETEVGLKVFSLAMPSTVAGLFAVVEPAGGCVGVNARHPFERQRWTLAHEYGHFVLHRYAAEVTSVVPSKAREEQTAEAFAAAFLMPKDGLTRRFQNARRQRAGTVTAVDILQLGAAYEVSAQAIALRLEDLGLLAGGWWDSLVQRGLRVQDARDSIGIPTKPRDEEAVPRRTQYLAAEAFLEGRLSEGRLARLLRTDRVAARDVVHRLAGSQDVEQEGRTRQWFWEPEPEIRARD